MMQSSPDNMVSCCYAYQNMPHGKGQVQTYVGRQEMKVKEAAREASQVQTHEAVTD